MQRIYIFKHLEYFMLDNFIYGLLLWCYNLVGILKFNKSKWIKLWEMSWINIQKLLNMYLRILLVAIQFLWNFQIKTSDLIGVMIVIEILRQFFNLNYLLYYYLFCGEGLKYVQIFNDLNIELNEQNIL